MSKTSRQRQVWRPKRSENDSGSAGAVVVVNNADDATRQNGGGGSGGAAVAVAVDAAALQTSVLSVAVADTRQQQRPKPVDQRQKRQYKHKPKKIEAEVTAKPEIESLGPPVTWHVTHDFVVTEPTANLFNVPNCLTDPSPDSGRFVRSSLQVHPKLSKFSQINLTEGGQRIKTSPNAGGNSVASEVISFEVMRAAYGADLLKTEMQLEYFPMGGSITDYSVMLYDLHIGVSVTRAMKYNGVFDTTDATRLLKKKLQGVIDSSRLVVEPFHKQVLHIFCEADYVVDVLEEVYYGLDPALKGSTLVVATSANSARWVFTNHYDYQ